MGIIILFVIVILFFGILIRRIVSQREREEQSYTESSSVSSRYYSLREVLEETKGVGKVTPTEDGGWILNPKSTFPLTIYGVDRDVVEELKQRLDKEEYESWHAKVKSIMPILLRSNLRCKEIEDYIKEFKPRYIKKIEELKKSSPEWQEASEKDREDLLAEFRIKALESIEVRPHCNLTILFEYEPEDITIDDALLDRYGFDALDLYFRYVDNLDRVRVIPITHRERKKFEKLVEVGLARRGLDIPMEKILEMLKLKELNEIVSDLVEKPFTRKTKAIEFILGLPDVKERVGKVVAFRELFELQPLPSEFSHVDVEKVKRMWRYFREVAFLIAHTYLMGKLTAANIRQYGETQAWEICPAMDACPYCQKMVKKVYYGKEPPKVPLHIGCRCTLLPKIE